MRLRKSLEIKDAAFHAVEDEPENPSILNIVRLPARLDLAQAAEFLGFSAHDVLVLVRERLILPLDSSDSDALPVHFYSVELQGQANDRNWLVRANEVVLRHRHEETIRNFETTPGDRLQTDTVQSNQASAKDAPTATPIRVALKLKEAAACLGVSEHTVRRLIDRGLLRRSRALRHVIIDRKES